MLQACYSAFVQCTQACEHYIGHGVCTDYQDWSIAAAGSETNVRIGYEYGRFVTGVDQEIEPHLIEPDLDEAMHSAGDQVVLDPQEEISIVVTSGQISRSG